MRMVYREAMPWWGRGRVSQPVARPRPGNGQRRARPWGHVPRRCRVLTIAVLVVLLVTMTLADLAPALLPDGTGSTVVAPTR